MSEDWNKSITKFTSAFAGKVFFSLNWFVRFQGLSCRNSPNITQFAICKRTREGSNIRTAHFYDHFSLNQPVKRERWCDRLKVRFACVFCERLRCWQSETSECLKCFSKCFFKHFFLNIIEGNSRAHSILKASRTFLRSGRVCDLCVKDFGYLLTIQIQLRSTADSRRDVAKSKVDVDLQTCGSFS